MVVQWVAPCHPVRFWLVLDGAVTGLNLVTLLCCMSQEPEVWDLVNRIQDVVKPYGVEVLGEVHEDFHLNLNLAR